MTSASVLMTPLLLMVIGSLVSLGIIAVGAWIGLRWMRQSGTLPAQQNAIAALNTTLSAMRDRMGLLESQIAEREARHKEEMTELRGQMNNSLMAKDTHIRELETKIAEQQVQINQQGATQTRLKEELGLAQATLAEYAQRVLPDLPRKHVGRRSDAPLRPVPHEGDDASSGG